MTQKTQNLLEKDRFINRPFGVVHSESDQSIILSEVIVGLSYQSNLEAEGLKVYAKNINEEFDIEWDKQKFKWFFKKKRTRKIKNRIYKKYKFKIFDIVDRICEIEIPIKIDEMISDFQYVDTVDQVDVIYPVGDFTPLLDSLKSDYGKLFIDKNIKQNATKV